MRKMRELINELVRQLGPLTPAVMVLLILGPAGFFFAWRERKEHERQEQRRRSTGG